MYLLGASIYVTNCNLEIEINQTHPQIFQAAIFTQTKYLLQEIHAITIFTQLQDEVPPPLNIEEKLLILQLSMRQAAAMALAPSLGQSHSPSCCLHPPHCCLFRSPYRSSPAASVPPPPPSLLWCLQVLALLQPRAWCMVQPCSSSASSMQCYGAELELRSMLQGCSGDRACWCRDKGKEEVDGQVEESGGWDGYDRGRDPRLQGGRSSTKRRKLGGKRKVGGRGMRGRSGTVRVSWGGGGRVGACSCRGQAQREVKGGEDRTGQEARCMPASPPALPRTSPLLSSTACSITTPLIACPCHCLWQ